MILADLIYWMRNRLVEALDKDDRQELANLMSAFQMVLDASYTYENRELSGLLQDLVYSAQHGAMGVQFKARGAVPTDEAIEKVFAS